MFSKIFSICIHTLFFFIKHFFLFFSLYFITQYVILKLVFETFSTLTVRWVEYTEFFVSVPFISTPFSTQINIFHIFLGIFVIALKLGFYNIAISNEKENISPDIATYLTEFIANFHYIFLNTYSFFFFLLLSSLTIIGPYFYINLYGYYSIFTIQINANGKNYNHIQSLKNGRVLASNFPISLFLINTILVSLYIFLYLLVPSNLVFSDINISILLKNIFLDCILVHFIYTAHKINNIKEEKESITKQKEEASKEDILRRKREW